MSELAAFVCLLRFVLADLCWLSDYFGALGNCVTVFDNFGESFAAVFAALFLCKKKKKIKFWFFALLFWVFPYG